MRAAAGRRRPPSRPGSRPGGEAGVAARGSALEGLAESERAPGRPDGQQADQEARDDRRGHPRDGGQPDLAGLLLRLPLGPTGTGSGSSSGSGWSAGSRSSVAVAVARGRGRGLGHLVDDDRGLGRAPPPRVGSTAGSGSGATGSGTGSGLDWLGLGDRLGFRLGLAARDGSARLGLGSTARPTPPRERAPAASACARNRTTGARAAGRPRPSLPWRGVCHAEPGHKPDHDRGDDDSGHQGTVPASSTGSTLAQPQRRPGPPRGHRLVTNRMIWAGRVAVWSPTASKCTGPEVVHRHTARKTKNPGPHAEDQGSHVHWSG